MSQNISNRHKVPPILTHRSQSGYRPPHPTRRKTQKKATFHVKQLPKTGIRCAALLRSARNRHQTCPLFLNAVLFHVKQSPGVSIGPLLSHIARKTTVKPHLCANLATKAQFHVKQLPNGHLPPDTALLCLKRAIKQAFSSPWCAFHVKQVPKRRLDRFSLISYTKQPSSPSFAPIWTRNLCFT